MRTLNETEKAMAERIFALAQELSPEGRQMLAIYGEALRDAMTIREKKGA